jgi:hypothetical protein
MNPRVERVLGLMVLALLFCAVTSAYAYVGPGSGVTVIGAALALIGGVILAIVGFVWYPIKRLLRLRQRTGSAAGSDAVDPTA